MAIKLSHNELIDIVTKQYSNDNNYQNSFDYHLQGFATFFSGDSSLAETLSFISSGNQEIKNKEIISKYNDDYIYDISKRI